MANAKRKCGGCSKYFRPQQEFPGPVAWCGTECALIVAKKRVPAVKAKIQKQERAKHRKEKASMRANDLPHQKELTRIECNKMIRLLDRGKSCPTCGGPLVDGMYDAGHVRTVASCPELRYDPRAIFGQCRSCNVSGTIRKRTRKTQEVVSGLYKDWVLREKGQEHYDWLFGHHRPKHYTCDKLREMRKMFSAESRRLEKGLPPSRDWRDLRLQQHECHEWDGMVINYTNPEFDSCLCFDR